MEKRGREGREGGQGSIRLLILKWHFDFFLIVFGLGIDIREERRGECEGEGDLLRYLCFSVQVLRRES